MHRAALVGLLALAAVCMADACRVSYASSPWPPLLFGGVSRSCKSNCASRSDGWAKKCSFVPGSAWGTCSAQQAARSLELAKTLGGGIQSFSPCDLERYLRGRTLWVIGDSHAKSLYTALQCFLTDFAAHKECEASADSSAVQQLANLPAARGQSKCFPLLAGGRVCFVHVVLGTSLVNNNQVAEGGVLPLLRSKFASKDDIFYINFGVWHRKSTAWWDDYRPALEALGRYHQATRSQWPYLLFRETPASHPADPSGNSCQALQGISYDTSSRSLQVSSSARVDPKRLWALGTTTNSVAHEVLGKYSIPVVGGFSISAALADTHVGRSGGDLDCLHYCHPGVPEMYVWFLYEAMSRGAVSPLDKSVQAEAGQRCVPSYTAGFRR